MHEAIVELSPTIPRLEPKERKRERDAGKISGDDYEIPAQKPVPYPAGKAKGQ